MTRPNSGYVHCLRDCVLRALRMYQLPMMIETSALLPEVEAIWTGTSYGKTVDLNAVILGRMMGRMGFAQIKGANRNGWFVESLP